jgi:microcystin-dependent protein
MSLDPAPIPNPWFSPAGPGGLPVGSVVAFAGQLGPSVPPVPPDLSPPVGTTSPIEAWGWMACDGRQLQIVEYPELYAVLGNLYGGDLDSNSFRLPDYRGYFLRGIDGGTGRDPDSAGRTAPGPSGTAASPGSTQPFAVQSHEHAYLKSLPAGVAQEGEDSGVPTAQTTLTQGGPVAAQGAPKVLVSPNETRPINIYVNYIIKFTSGPRPAHARSLIDGGE